jgi:hypothetical protein
MLDLEPIFRRWLRPNSDLPPSTLLQAKNDIKNLLQELGKARMSEIDAVIEADALTFILNNTKQSLSRSILRTVELEDAIADQRAGVYSGREPKCKHNRALYAVLDKEVTP